MWTLTYSVDGKRHVEFIPDVLLSEVQPLAEQGRAHRDAMREVFTINAQLLTMWRQQFRDRYAKSKGSSKRGRSLKTRRGKRKKKSTDGRSRS